MAGDSGAETAAAGVASAVTSTTAAVRRAALRPDPVEIIC